VTALAVAAVVVAQQPAFAADEVATTADGNGDAVAPIVARIVADLDPRVADALARMDGEGRRLLAVRSYLRSRAHLTERWSWTAEQIAAYESSPGYAELQAEIERVRAAFAQENPGFELWVNPQVRNLDVQLEHWNTNESVAAAAEVLLASARAFASTEGFERMDPTRAQREFAQFLTAYVPVPTPTMAAPGLSPHGQMHAIDFQVHKDGVIVAGTRTSTISQDWDGAGWTEKLEIAVRSASPHFVGPLESPREPWHYTYAPESIATQ
jgi:hypothetical protein